MITINLTTEDYILMKNLLIRITNQIEREPVNRHWIKDGQYMVNTRSGTRIDIVTNELSRQIGERSGSDDVNAFDTA